MTPTWISIYQSGTNRLIFRYDPRRRIVEHVDRRIKTVVDLEEEDRKYAAPESAEGSDSERNTAIHSTG